MTERIDAGEVAQLLARRIGALAPELLPGGKREGHEWRAGSLAGEPGKSLGVHLAGSKAGVWCDFASGECGDALDLVAQCRCGGDKRAAFAWAKCWLGLDSNQHPGESRGPAGQRTPAEPWAPPPGRAADDDAGRRQKAALRLWLEAAPIAADSPAALYLRGRGIDLARLGRVPRALRCHRALPHRPSGRTFPALVAAVSGADGRHVATHRTWLTQYRIRGWQKAPVEHAKMSIGPVSGGTIRIWRGASGKPLREAPDGEVLGLGEGIETCLSVASACPELRVLCAVSLGNMASVCLPPAIREVIIFADNDDGAPARRGLQRAVDRFVAEGRLARIARAPWGKDFNDVLRVA